MCLCMFMWVLSDLPKAKEDLSVAPRLAGQSMVSRARHSGLGADFQLFIFHWCGNWDEISRAWHTWAC